MIPQAQGLILHGAVISLLASLAGFVYGRTLVRSGDSEHQRQAWRLVHSAGSLAGVALVALGAAVPVLAPSPAALGVLFYSALATGYLFLLGMGAAALSGERGLRPGGSVGNQVAYGAYLAASAATLVLWTTVLVLALD